MTTDKRHTNIFYRLTVIPVVALIITVLALTATFMGNPAAPAARFLDRYAGVLITVEVVLSLVLGFIAVAVDRRGIEEARRGGADAGQEDDGPVRETGRGPETERSAGDRRENKSRGESDSHCSPGNSRL